MSLGEPRAGATQKRTTTRISCDYRNDPFPNLTPRLRPSVTSNLSRLPIPLLDPESSIETSDVTQSHARLNLKLPEAILGKSYVRRGTIRPHQSLHGASSVAIQRRHEHCFSSRICLAAAVNLLAVHEPRFKSPLTRPLRKYGIFRRLRFRCNARCQRANKYAKSQDTCEWSFHGASL